MRRDISQLGLSQNAGLPHFGHGAQISGKRLPGQDRSAMIAKKRKERPK
jgi:hypothetical protein